MEVIVVYGYNIVEVLGGFKQKCIKEIEKLTAMSVTNMEILARGIYIEETSEQ